MTKIVLFVISLVTSFSIVAQGDNPFMSTDFTQITRLEFDRRVASPDLKTKLFCEVWCEGQVITRLDTLDVKFNYDLSDEFFYINMNEKVFTIKSDFIIGFIMNERPYLCYNGYDEDKVMILETLVRGDYTLYKHHGIKYFAPDFDPILNIGNKEPTYKRTTDYFTYCGSGLHEISSKPKKALKVLQKECGVAKGMKAKGDIEQFFEELNSID